MARVACLCGQLITQNLINGEPRTHCPFCRREVKFDARGQIIGANTELATGISREAPTPGRVQAVYPTSVAAPRSAAPASVVAAQRQAARPTTQPRYVQELNVHTSAHRLREFVGTLAQRHAGKLVCSRKTDCQVSACSRAFACGLLPRRLSGPIYIALWALGGATVMLAFFGLICLILLTSPPPTSTTQPDPWRLLPLGVSYCTAAALLAGGFGALQSYGRQQHVRGLASVAEQHGLQFWPQVDLLPYQTTAIPLMVPTLARDPFGENDPDRKMTLAATGRWQGQEVYLADCRYTFDPRDFLPHGGFLKVAQAIARPSTAFRRQRIERTVTVVYFPEALTRTPDLVLARERRHVETHFLKYAFKHQIVAPQQGRKRYFLATISQLEGTRLAAPLMELLDSYPGHTIQVIGGVLMVSGDSCYTWWSLRLPRKTQLHELFSLACEVRAVLLREAAN